MIYQYYKGLHDAFVERRTAHVPGALFTIFAVIGCTLAYIMLAIVLIPPDVLPDYHFYEGGPITALSAFFLAVASAFSLTSMVTIIRVRGHYKWVWLVLAFGFSFLALDELMEFHERVGRQLERFWSSGVFRSWDDIIVILYGVVAVPIFLAIIPGLMRWRLVFEMFTIGLVFYGIHTFIDSTNEPPTSTSVVLEESAKLLCGAFLALGAFSGFIGVLWKSTTFQSTDNDA